MSADDSRVSLDDLALTLRERLLAAAASRFHIWAPPPAADDLAARERAVRAVVELHAPRPCACAEAPHVICAGCPGHAIHARCHTIRAIADALGVQTGETT